MKDTSRVSWQSMFDILTEDAEVQTKNGIIVKRSYYVILKSTGEKMFTKTRKYGYSSMIDACRGAAHIYRNHNKIMEKVLLG